MEVIRKIAYKFKETKTTLRRLMNDLIYDTAKFEFCILDDFYERSKRLFSLELN